jgi:hypothetical protein
MRVEAQRQASVRRGGFDFMERRVGFQPGFISGLLQEMCKGPYGLLDDKKTVASTRPATVLSRKSWT